MADLKARVKELDVKEWWGEYENLNTPLKLQARKEATVVDRSQLHNPYAGLEYAWQLTETIEEFVVRVPPATTDVTPESRWIWVCNPYIRRKSKREASNQMIRGGEDEAPEEQGADLPSVVEGGMARLHFASEFIDVCKNSGGNPNFVRRECQKAGTDAAKDILDLAQTHRVRCGKVSKTYSYHRRKDTTQQLYLIRSYLSGCCSAPSSRSTRFGKSLQRLQQIMSLELVVRLRHDRLVIGEPIGSSASTPPISPTRKMLEELPRN